MDPFDEDISDLQITITSVPEETGVNSGSEDNHMPARPDNEKDDTRQDADSQMNPPGFDSETTPSPLTHRAKSSSLSSCEGGDEGDGGIRGDDRVDEDSKDDDKPKSPFIHSNPGGNEEEEAEREAARNRSLEKLQGTCQPTVSYQPPSSRGLRSPKKKGRRRSRVPDGIIILKEEKATIFHDFLKFVYPQYV